MRAIYMYDPFLSKRSLFDYSAYESLDKRSARAEQGLYSMRADLPSHAAKVPY